MKKLNALTARLSQSRIARAAGAGGVFLATGVAHAAATTIDVTDVVSTVTAGVVTISSIGIAVLSLVVVIKLFKWAQRIL